MLLVACCLLLDAWCVTRNIFLQWILSLHESQTTRFLGWGRLPGDIGCFALSLIKPALVECWPLGRSLCLLALSFSCRHMEGWWHELTLLSAFRIRTWKGRKSSQHQGSPSKKCCKWQTLSWFYGPKLPCYLNKRTLALEGHAAFKSCDTFSSFSTH